MITIHALLKTHQFKHIFEPRVGAVGNGHCCEVGRFRKNLPEIVSCLQDKDSLTRQAAASTLAVAPDAVLADPKKLRQLQG